MNKQRWWIAAALLGISASVLFTARPQAADPTTPPVGRYQISAFPGRPAQFAMETQGVGCYLVDTTTGELWFLSTDGQQKNAWRKLAGPPQ